MATKPDRSVRLSKAAIDALWQGNVVRAINLVRKERGIGMAEAKELVVMYIGTQPALKKKNRSGARNGQAEVYPLANRTSGARGWSRLCSDAGNVNQR
jgi:hypothetical protein